MDLFTDTLFLYPLVAGLAIAVAAAPFGCLMLWKRYVFFGDSIAHAALVPLALASLLSASYLSWLLVFIFCILLALLIACLQRYGHLANDAILAVLSNTGLAIGTLIALSVSEQRRFDFESYLFGNFLTVSKTNVILITVAATIALIGITIFWRRLLIIIFNADIARLENIPVFKIELLFAALLAIIIVCAIHVLGLLLTVSILIMPAAAAAGAGSTKNMVVISAAFGIFAVVVGLSAAFVFNTPPGPAIVLAASIPLTIKAIRQALLNAG